MTLNELKERVVETLGEDIIDIDTLLSGVANCYADMTSRGYRLFQEKEFTKEDMTFFGNDMVEIDAPNDIRKTLYLKLIFEKGALTANRMNLADAYIRSHYQNGCLKTNLYNIGMASIFYIRKDKIIAEFTESLGKLLKIELGYYKKLKKPDISGYNEGDDIGQIELDIREEFSDAVVLFLAWYIAARSQEDTARLSMFLNQYKYYMEDLLFELQHEDGYEISSSIVVHEED
jgi:hypothetical protein